jgi:hypothetical protein
MTTPEDPEPAEQSDHLKAIAKHAKKRTAHKAYLASGAVKPKRTRSTSKLVSRSIEPRPAYDGTTPEERREIASQESFQRRADNAAALARPTVLTPLQIKRMERTKSGRAYMAKVTKQPDPSIESHSIDFRNTIANPPAPKGPGPGL